MTAWTLVFHLLGMVFWVGGLSVVTNVLARHTQENSPEARHVLTRMEMKLFNGMAHPGAALMVITGIILIVTNPSYYLHAPWLHAKLFLVAILIGLDLIAYSRARAFQSGRIALQRREFMALHGAISLIFFGILILVLVKPFERHNLGPDSRTPQSSGIGRRNILTAARPPWKQQLNWRKAE